MWENDEKGYERKRNKEEAGGKEMMRGERGRGMKKKKVKGQQWRRRPRSGGEQWKNTRTQDVRCSVSLTSRNPCLIPHSEDLKSKLKDDN